MVAEFCAVRPENTKSAVRSSGDGCRLGVPIEPVPGSHFKSSTYDTHRLALGLTRKPIVTGSVRDSGGLVIRNSMAYAPPPLSLSWPHLAGPGHEIVNPVKKRKARF